MLLSSVSNATISKTLFFLWLIAFKATEEEVQNSMKVQKSKRPAPKKVAAAKTLASRPQPKQDAPASPGEPSPNPAPHKRIKGKQAPPDQDPQQVIKDLMEACLFICHCFYSLRLQLNLTSSKCTLWLTRSFLVYVPAWNGVHVLWEANKAMQREMDKLRASGSTTSKKGKDVATPTPKIPAPSPANTPVPKSGKSVREPMPPPERPPPATEGAKMNRLRRLCEVKPSGRCNVPQAIHERWAKSTKDEKEAMIEELEQVGWSKDWLSTSVQHWSTLFMSHRHGYM